MFCLIWKMWTCKAPGNIRCKWTFVMLSVLKQMTLCSPDLYCCKFSVLFGLFVLVLDELHWIKQSWVARVLFSAVTLCRPLYIVPVMLPPAPCCQPQTIRRLGYHTAMVVSHLTLLMLILMVNYIFIQYQIHCVSVNLIAFINQTVFYGFLLIPQNKVVNQLQFVLRS